MNTALQQALERLAETRAGLKGPSSFQLWELRGALRVTPGRGTATLAADGGWRLEWGPDRARRWCFAIGAGPAAALRARSATPARRSLDPAGWKAALDALGEALREEHRRLGPEAAAGCEVHIRWRAWRRGAADPQAAVDRGVRVHQPGETEGADANPKERADTRDRPGGTGRWSGPLVLLPRAAGWWVHEMGHAALESATRLAPVPADHGFEIIDDPRAGPWPAGFSIDDAGERARPARLWDARGPRTPAPRGRWRRPSVREAAEPALSVTRLVGSVEGSGVAWSDLPCGTPVATAVRAGRYDPASGTIALELEGVGQVGNQPGRAGSARAVALIEPAEGWRSLRPMAAAPDEETARFAVCSRQGATVSVMVGAPTIVLDAVQVLA